MPNPFGRLTRAGRSTGCGPAVTNKPHEDPKSGAVFCFINKEQHAAEAVGLSLCCLERWRGTCRPAGMAARFINLDRHTPMFLPCDLRDWVSAGHIVHFILDAAEQIPADEFRINHRGSGSAQYPPTMVLAWLIYSYATGRFGSRTIEAATHSDVAVRYLCANHHPDHDSICAFRTANEAPSEPPSPPCCNRRSNCA